MKEQDATNGAGLQGTGQETRRTQQFEASLPWPYPFLVAILLSWGSLLIASSRPQFLAAIGLLVGFIDPKRGVVWASATVLPYFVLAGSTLGWVIGSGGLAAIPYMLWVNVTPYVLLAWPAILGACVGGLVRVLVFRCRGGTVSTAIPLEDAVLIAAVTVGLFGFDHYRAILFDEYVRLRWPWSMTGGVLVATVVVGVGAGLAVAARWLSMTQERVGCPSGQSGRAELALWIAVSGVLLARRLAFETCLLVWPMSVTACFNGADLAASVTLGLGVGGLMGIYGGMKRSEGCRSTVSRLALAPGPSTSGNVVASSIVLGLILVYLGYRVWNI